MKSLLLAALTLVLIASVSAQNTPKMPTKSGQINVNKVVSEKNISRPATLPTTEKIKVVQDALKGKVKPEKLSSLTLTQPIMLDTRTSFAEDKAILSFNNAEVVSPYKNTASFAPDTDGSLTIYFNAPAAGAYLLDFSLQIEAATMTFTSFMSAVDKKSVPFNPKHVLFLADAKAAGWQAFNLSADKYWTFFSCEISLVK